MKARSASSQGRFAEAAAFLKNLPDLDKGGEQSEFLLDLYLKNCEIGTTPARWRCTFLKATKRILGWRKKLPKRCWNPEQTERALALVSTLAHSHARCRRTRSRTPTAERSCRQRCRAGWSRWNGWSIPTAAPAIRSVCRTRWRTWATRWSPRINCSAPRKFSNSWWIASRKAIPPSAS